MVETPQPVEFFQGTLIDRRPATFEYGRTAGIGVAAVPTYPYFTGLAAGGSGGTVGIGGAFAGIAVLAAGVAPNVPATEFTVCLDRGTFPASPYLPPGAPAAIIIVQNDFPPSYDVPNGFPDDRDMLVGTPVLVRVVGNAGRVIRDPARPPATPRGGPVLTQCSSANGPKPVPLQGAAAVASLPPVQSYGYRQALGQALYQHWTIEP